MISCEDYLLVTDTLSVTIELVFPSRTRASVTNIEDIHS